MLRMQSVGYDNHVWLAKIDKLNRVKEYLYFKTDTAERIRKLGWNATEGFLCLWQRNIGRRYFSGSR